MVNGIQLAPTDRRDCDRHCNIFPLAAKAAPYSPFAEIWNMRAYQIENQRIEVRTAPPEHLDGKPTRECHKRGVDVRIEQLHF